MSRWVISSGWRIQRPRPQNEARMKISRFAIVGGVLVAAAGVATGVLSVLPWPIAGAIAGLGVLASGGLFVVKRVIESVDWQLVQGRVVDYEVQQRLVQVVPGPDIVGKVEPGYMFRVICQVEHEGQWFHTVPQCPKVFESQEELERWFQGWIERDGRCQLWINSREPSQSFLGRERPVITVDRRDWPITADPNRLQ